MEKPAFNLSIPELHAAKSIGFVHDFMLHVNGLLYCLTNPNHYYDMHEFFATAIPCALQNATIYLISTDDGVNGTMIEYHEA